MKMTLGCAPSSGSRSEDVIASRAVWKGNFMRGFYKKPGHAKYATGFEMLGRSCRFRRGDGGEERAF